MNAHDATYYQRESTPAQHSAVNGDLLDIRLVPDTLEALGDLWVDVFVEFCAEHNPCRKEWLSERLDAISARERAVKS